MPAPRLITYRGRTKNIRQWSRETGIHPATLLLRLNSGKPPDELFAPVQRRVRDLVSVSFDELEPGQTIGNMVFLRLIRSPESRVPKALFRSKAGWTETFTPWQFAEMEL